MRLSALLVLWVAAPALAEDAVQAYLRAANKLYQQLEYEKALVQVQRAKKSAAKLDDDVAIGLWEGIILFDLGRADDARAAFSTALALKADAVLPVKVSPKVTAAFEKLRAEAQKELAKTPPPVPVATPAPVPEPPPPVPVVTLAPPPPTPPPAVEVKSEGGGARRAAFVPFGLGGVGAVVGVVGAVIANGAASQLKNDRFASASDAMAVRSQGELFQIVGFAGLGVGVAGVVTGALMLLLGGPAQVALVPNAGGATVSFHLELP